MVTRRKVSGRVKQAASQAAGASRKSATDDALTADRRAESEEGRRRAAENFKRRALDSWEDEGGSLAGTGSLDDAVEKSRKS